VNDQQLLAAYLQGDERALETLVAIIGRSSQPLA